MQQRWGEALSIYEDAIRLAREAGHPAYLAKALTGAAKVEALEHRNYGAALARIEEAISLSTSPEDRRVHVESLEEKAHVQVSLRCMSAAAATLGRALKVAEDLKDETRLVYVHYARGSVYFQMAYECAPRWQLAQARCGEALDLATMHSRAAQRLANQLGYHGFAKLMNRDASLEKFRMMVSIQEQLSKKFLEARVFEPEVPSNVLVNEMFVTAGEAGGEDCQQFRRAGEPVLTAGKDPLSLHTRGQMELMCGRADDALVLFRKAIEELEKDRRNAPDECGPGSFLQDKTAFYELPAALLLQRQDRAGAFELLERSRSSVLADLLATRTLGLTDAKERTLYAEASGLRAEIGVVQKRLFELDNTPEGEQHAVEIADRRAKLGELESSYQRLMNRMEREAPRLKELSASRPVTLENLQGVLRRDRLEMLYYLVRDGDFILWYIGPEDVHVRVVFLPRPALVQKVEELRRSLTDEHAEFNERRAHQLFLYLIKPALEWLKL
jgi:tetratricopeptide (TPR) repeat protein